MDVHEHTDSGLGIGMILGIVLAVILAVLVLWFVLGASLFGGRTGAPVQPAQPAAPAAPAAPARPSNDSPSVNPTVQVNPPTQPQGR